MNDLHRKLSEDLSESRRRAVDAHNRKTNVVACNFEVGDFVLVRRSKPGGHKLQFAWQGPRRIVDIKSPWVYEVQDLIEGKSAIVHATRLLKYRGDIDGREVSPKLLRAAQHLEAEYQSVEAIRDIRNRNSSIEVFVEWEGLPDASDFTWEPLLQLYFDIPEMLHEYLKTTGKESLKRQAQNLIANL